MTTLSLPRAGDGLLINGEEWEVDGATLRPNLIGSTVVAHRYVPNDGLGLKWRAPKPLHMVGLTLVRTSSGAPKLILELAWRADQWSYFPGSRYDPYPQWTLKKGTMTLTDILSEVSAERVYAATKWPTPDDESVVESHAFGEWLLYAKQYLDEAISEASHAAGNAAARKKIIKTISLLAWAAQHPMSVAMTHPDASYHVKEGA